MPEPREIPCEESTKKKRGERWRKGNASRQPLPPEISGRCFSKNAKGETPWKKLSRSQRTCSGLDESIAISDFWKKLSSMVADDVSTYQ